MYLMISFMGVLSKGHKWKLVIEAEGYSYGKFTREFFRFITPAISPVEKTHPSDTGDFTDSGFMATEPLAPEKKKRVKS
jgi:TetR/AcrR family transcriptional regulator